MLSDIGTEARKNCPVGKKTYKAATYPNLQPPGWGEKEIQKKVEWLT